MDSKRSLIRPPRITDLAPPPEPEPRQGPLLVGCPFCGAPHPAAAALVPTATCGKCASPLFPAARLPVDGGVRRALARAPREMAMTYWLLGPKFLQFKGVTEDVSITGMRFRSEMRLLSDERVKIDCDFCAAVGDVRHTAPVAGSSKPRFSIGVAFVTLWIKTPHGQFVDLKT